MADQSFIGSNDKVELSNNEIDSNDLSESANDRNLDQYKHLPPLPVSEEFNGTEKDIDDSSLIIGLPPRSAALDNSQLELTQDIPISDKDMKSTKAQESNSALSPEIDLNNDAVMDANQMEEDYSLMDPNHV